MSESPAPASVSVSEALQSLLTALEASTGSPKIDNVLLSEVTEKLATLKVQNSKKVIFLIGATGAQGTPIAKALLAPSADGTPSPYAVRALTRNPEHRRAKDLVELGVEVVKGWRIFIRLEI